MLNTTNRKQNDRTDDGGPFVEVVSVQLGIGRASVEVFRKFSRPRLGRVALDLLDVGSSDVVLVAVVEDLSAVIVLLIGGRCLDRRDGVHCCR